MNWYSTLNKSFLSPPPVVFSIVWIVLYILIGTSFILYLVKNPIKNKIWGIALFVFHMALNFAWPVVFFKLHNAQIAFFIILIMILSVFGLIFIFKKVSKLASYLLIPYSLWLIFAAYLNFEIIRLN